MIIAALQVDKLRTKAEIGLRNPDRRHSIRQMAETLHREKKVRAAVPG